MFDRFPSEQKARLNDSRRKSKKDAATPHHPFFEGKKLPVKGAEFRQRFDAQCAANELKVKRGSRSKQEYTRANERSQDKGNSTMKKTQSFTRRLCKNTKDE
jgi:hypothetical protein